METKSLVIGIVVTILLVVASVGSYNYGYTKAEKAYNNNRFEGIRMKDAAVFPIAICKSGSEFYVTSSGDVRRQLQNINIETCFGGRTFLYSEELVPYVLADNRSTWVTP